MIPAHVVETRLLLTLGSPQWVRDELEKSLPSQYGVLSYAITIQAKLFRERLQNRSHE